MNTTSSTSYVPMTSIALRHLRRRGNAALGQSGSISRLHSSFIAIPASPCRIIDSPIPINSTYPMRGACSKIKSSFSTAIIPAKNNASAQSTASSSFSSASSSSSSAPAASSLSSAVSVPIPPNSTPTAQEEPTYTMVDFESAADIQGEESQIVVIQIKPGECIRAEAGSMIYMTDGVVMNTSLQGASAAFTRMMTGQNMFLTDFTCDSVATVDNNSGSADLAAATPQRGAATLCLGTSFPSKILRLNLQDMPNESLICQNGAFLASNPTVNIEMAFTKNLSTGFFGGQGFILQKLTGTGHVLVKGGGTIMMRDLKTSRDTLRVTSGSIVAFESTVDYDIQMMPGFKNVMFGGEGLFVTTLTGPGRVWLQGMPPDRMIGEIARRVPSGMGIGFGIPMMGGGAGGSSDGSGSGVDATSTSVDEGGSDALSSVAATDGVIDADRQATIATSGTMESNDSGIDSESPSALFGDALPRDTANSTSAAGVSDGELFNDSGSAIEGTSQSTSEDESSFTSSLWNFFTGDEV